MDVGSSSWGCHCICEEALSSAFLPKPGPDGSVSMHYCAPDCCLTKPLRTWMYKCGLMEVMLRQHGSLLSCEAPVCIRRCGPFTRWAKEWLVPITVLLYLHAITPYTSLLQHRSTCSRPLDSLMFIPKALCKDTSIPLTKRRRSAEN